MANGKLLVDKATGQKMYPVGKWYTYQHVFYNACDRAANELWDAIDNGGDIDKASDWNDKVQDMLCKWDSNPRRDGIVYATYEDYKVMKDIIGAYAWRHNGYV